MTKDEIVATAKAMVESGLPFIFATVDAAGAPQARWMGAKVLDEPFTVYMESHAQARKMDQIRQNPRGQLVFHTPDYMQIATISGVCEVCEDREVYRRIWEAIPELANYISGPDDPGFGAVKFKAQQIEPLFMAPSPRTERADL
jgi:general stress protein 26